MTDIPPSDDVPHDPTIGGGAGAGGEDELNSALEQASELAVELAKQLNGGDTAEQPVEVPIRSQDATDSPDIERQMSELDRLVATTSHELDSSEQEADAPTIVEGDSADSTASEAMAVPDFMDEFTRPEQAPGSAPRSSRYSGPTESEPAVSGGGQGDGSPKPGVVGTGILGVMSPAIESQTGDKEPESAAAIDRVKRFNAGAAVLLRLREVAATGVKRMSELSLPAFERIVTVLEQADRPFSRLKEPIRRAIGWLAVATLGTSALVFLWSLI